MLEPAAATKVNPEAMDSEVSHEGRGKGRANGCPTRQWRATPDPVGHIFLNDLDSASAPCRRLGLPLPRNQRRQLQEVFGAKV
jgi:hypothetical protein